MITGTLLLVLGSLVAPGDETAPGPVVAATSGSTQDPERPPIASSELKALRENNIFAPKSAKLRPPKAPTGVKSSAPEVPTKPKAPVVTGIFVDEKSGTARVIVEDKNDSSHKFFREPKFLKAGDEFGGYKLDLVTLEKAVFVKGGTSKEFAVGDSLADFEGTPGAGASPEDDFGEEGGNPSADPARSAAPSPGPKGSSRSDAKSQNPEAQSQVLENMKRRVKKNRPADPDE